MDNGTDAGCYVDSVPCVGYDVNGVASIGYEVDGVARSDVMLMVCCCSL